jgi:nucleotide-binding universal stress UspA family protein
MYDTILAAVDGSENGRRAARRAGELAASAAARLVLVTVEPRAPVPEELRAYAQAEHLDAGQTQMWEQIGREILHRAQEDAAAGGVEAGRVTSETRLGDPADAILDAARAHKADAIVVGSRGHGRVAGLLLGSVSQKLLSAARCDVLVVK